VLVIVHVHCSPGDRVTWFGCGAGCSDAALPRFGRVLAVAAAAAAATAVFVAAVVGVVTAAGLAVVAVVAGAAGFVVAVVAAALVVAVLPAALPPALAADAVFAVLAVVALVDDAVKLAVVAPVLAQAIDVCFQPAGRGVFSEIVYVPGPRCVSAIVLLAPSLITPVNGPPGPVTLTPKSWFTLAGTVAFTIVICPSKVLPATQVMTAPAGTVIVPSAATGNASPQSILSGRQFGPPGFSVIL